MAKCEEGYLCEVCGQEVEVITDSDLYLRYVIGEVDPEQLHTLNDRHIRCNPVVAQFIVDDSFQPAVSVPEGFGRTQLDREYVRDREALVTRGWKRLNEIANSDLDIVDYALPEVRDKWTRRATD